VKNILEGYMGNVFVLNVNDYYNIHVQWQPNTTETFWAAHIATILANPCPILAISYIRVFNSKIVNNELIKKHFDMQFITNLDISYHNRIQNYTREECSDEEVISRLMIYSYNMSSAAPTWSLDKELVGSCDFGLRESHDLQVA